MSVPAYLIGSQLGGILQNTTTPQAYTPGQGMPLYAPQQQQSGLQSYIPSIQPQGYGDARQQDEVTKLQQVLQDSVPGTPQYEFAKSQLSNLGALGGLSTFQSPTGTAQPQGQVPVDDGSFTVAGDGLGWGEQPSGAESYLGQSSLGQGTTPGNSALGSTGAGQAVGGSSSGGGLNLGQPYQTPGINPNFGSFQAPNTQPINYQAPAGDQATYQSPTGGGGSMAPGGTLQMQQANPQAALQQYMNTPGYQLLGNNQAQQFQASPGYQYAVDQALSQVGQNASARGLLGSGAMLRGMTDRAQGMASQEYGNWWNRQNQLYGDYQNRLAGLAGGPTGATEANQLGMNQAQLSAGMGTNLGSLFGNQGSTGMGGIINTGAAQANAMTQAGNQQAQILGANQATQLAGAVAQQKGLF